MSSRFADDGTPSGAAAMAASPRTLAEIFERQADALPEAVALQAGGRTLTYRELEENANRLASLLRGLGAGPGEIVGVLADRGLQTIVALLAVLKAGAAYAPLDPDSPPARTAALVDDLAPRALLAPAHLADRLPPRSDPTTVRLDRDLRALAAADPRRLKSTAGEGDLCAVLFTSGSTGAPKPVAIEHRNLLNLIAGTSDFAPLPGETALHTAAPQFDVAAYEVWATLARGGRLYCHPPGRPDPRELRAAVAEQRVGWAFLATGVFHQLVEGGPDRLAGLRMMIVGGEQMDPGAARRLRAACPATRLVNVYGPAETTVFVSAEEVREPQDDAIRVPIGLPVAGAFLRVLDDRLRPVGRGATGELCIGGPGITRGYVHTARRIASLYMSDPLSGERLYRSGDLGFEREDGRFEVVGRTDRQVKISGYRVEPAEVEAALARHPSVRRCVAALREPTPGRRLLAAYVLCEGGCGDVGALRAFMEARLPSYMVPVAIVPVATMPLTANGKIDRAALPDPLEALRGADAEPARAQAGPSPLTVEVAGVIAEVLGCDSLGPEEDFFSLGGNSLLAVRVLVRLRERFAVELPVAAMFEGRTAAALAATLEAARERTAEQRPPLPPLRPRGDAVGPVAASAGQAKALLIGELAQESLPYQSQVVFQIVGDLDIAALERALSIIVRRHEILRTTFERAGGRFVQVVHGSAPVRLHIEDLSGATDPQRAFRDHLAQITKIRLDPGRLPLARWSLVRLGGEQHALISLEHHAVHDGASTAIFLGELRDIYTAALQRHPGALPDLPVQYRDFACWQADLLESAVGAADLAYWQERLAGAPAQLPLPFDRPRPARQTYRGGTLRHALSEPLIAGLAARAAEWESTPFTVMLAAYCALLARYAGVEELTVGSGLANRRTLGSERLIGMVVNTVALRIDLSSDPGPREMARRVGAASLDAQAHQDLPFERVVERLRPARAANVSPFYQTLFSFHDSPVDAIEVPGAVIVPHDALPNGSAKADLSVLVIDRRGSRSTTASGARAERLGEQGMTIVWEYNSDLFDMRTAQRMLGHYRGLLERFAAGDERSLCSLPLGDLPPRRRRDPAVPAQLRADARDGEQETIVGAFEACASRTPTAAAVCLDGRDLSYRGLQRWSNRLARRLRSLGIGRGDRVAVCIERSLELIVALLAVNKAGAAFVPLEVSDPTARLRRHVRALNVGMLLTLARHRAAMPGPEAGIICLDDELDLSRELDTAPACTLSGTDPAYVMFTSGSSGEPKGVEVPHRAVVSLVGDVDYVQLGTEHSCLGLAPTAFDASTFEIWGALCNGGRLVLAPPGPLSTGELQALIAAEHVDTVWLTAGLLHRVVDDRPELLAGIGQLLAGGDVLSPDHVSRALAHLPRDGCLINCYGPTETTTFACAHRMRPGDHVDGPVPIGRPVAGRRIYILDAEGRQVPAGVAGEIFIGGDGVALGYAGDARLTAERFPSDPFAADPAARMYRSGDMGRMREDGTVEFLGRTDRQLKVRGFRVQPAEVERALRAHHGVADAHVAAFQRASGEVGLAAHVVPAPASEPAQPADLRRHLARVLPAHALPSAWSAVAELPLTANGKVDAAALPAPAPAGSREGAIAAGAGSSRPADDVERRLIAIWRRALEVDVVAPEDDFFDLGGHSLLAVEVFDAIERDFGAGLPLASIFEAPTVRQLAKLLREEGWSSRGGSLITLTASGRRPPLFFVSAGDGNAVGFGALARRLGPTQPFYALQPRGLSGGAPLSRTVEAMAAHYLRAIRKVSPRGPYLLGGRCLGALVAYEMARRLESAGREVALLIVLDSGGPQWRMRPLSDGTPFDEVMSSALRRPDAPLGLAEAFSRQGTARILRWLSEPVLSAADGTEINRYLQEVYALRADVRDIYPDIAGEDGLWFVGWAWTQGREQLGLSPRLLPLPANPQWREPLAPSGLRARIATGRARLRFRLAEATDLITGERRAGAAARRAARLRDASLAAWYGYRAGPYGGVVSLIRSEEFQVQPLLERWHVLQTAGVAERRVAGTHRSMLREPDVASLAACVAELVDGTLQARGDGEE